jgi:F0F1-type ATP synthase membrane subunit b/b'
MRESNVTDALRKGLETSQKEIEAGLTDAEAQLARLRVQCEQLQELIAVGKATLYAAQLKSLAERGADKPAPKISTGRADASEQVVKQLQNHVT